MKKRPVITALLLLGWISLPGATDSSPGVEFVGVLQDQKTTHFSLRTSPDGAGQWLVIGGAFHGYTLRSYDAKDEVLILTGDGKELRLHLIEGKTKPANTAKLDRATAISVFQNLRRIAAAADQYYLENAKTTTTVHELTGAKYLQVPPTPVAGENYGDLELRQDQPISLTFPQGETITVETTGQNPAGSTFYAIRAGDSASKIALLARQTLGDLLALNPGLDVSRLKIGDFVQLNALQPAVARRPQ